MVSTFEKGLCRGHRDQTEQQPYAERSAADRHRDELKGRYPKDFKFVGWHPHCRCHVVTVLKTEEEMQQDTQRILAGEQPEKGSVNAVRDVPAAFRDWVE